MNVKFKEVNTSKGKQRMLNIPTLASNVFMENDSNLQEYSNTNYIKSLSVQGFNLIVKNFNNTILDSIELPINKYTSLNENPVKIDSTTNIISHSTSGATAGSYGDKNAVTLNFGDSFKSLYASVDAYGHITYLNSHDVTLPTLSTATKTVAGIVKIGDNLNIDDKGLLSVDFSNVPTENTTYELSGSGNTVTLTGSDGSTTSHTITVPSITVDTELNSTSTNPIQNSSVYNALLNKVDTTRKVNGKTLDKDITLTAGDLGIDLSDASSVVLQQAYTYTDNAIDALIGGASGTADTLKELQDLIADNKSLIDTLNDAIGKKADKTDLSDHISDKVKHITSAERTSWTDAATKISGMDLTKYLPLVGGTITGDINFTGEENVFKRDSISTVKIVENTTTNTKLHLIADSSYGGLIQYYRGSNQWNTSINSDGNFSIHKDGATSIVFTSTSSATSVKATTFEGIATSANKINTNAGSSIRPVYFKNGVPVECDNTLAVNLPAIPEEDSFERVPLTTDSGIQWCRPKVGLQRQVITGTLNTGSKTFSMYGSSFTGHKYTSYDLIDVFINGLKLTTSEYSFDSVTGTITLTNAMISDDNAIEVDITYTNTDFYNVNNAE